MPDRVLISTPFCRAMVANVWRKSWNLTFGIPARASTCLSILFTLSGEMGPPLGEGKTYWSFVFSLCVFRTSIACCEILTARYRPLKGRDSFISYTETEFDDSCQRALAGFIEEKDARGAYIILSNSDPKNVDPEDDFFENLYADYDMQRINAKRKTNRNADQRGYITELLIRNY